MTTTTIEWAEQVWNPIVGCTVHSAGCTNCYAMRMAARLEAMADAGSSSLAHYRGTTRKVNGNAVWTGKLGFSETALLAPLKRKKPTRYFVNSMSDLFHEAVPDDWIERVFAVMALCSQHTFQVLTKRSARMREYCNDPMTPFRVAKAMASISGKPTEPEELRQIDGFPGYFVSSHGHVYSDRRGVRKRLRPDAGEQGHLRVPLFRDGGPRRGQRVLVHHLVLEAFDCAAPSMNAQGRHLDGDPSNNAIVNLEWGQQSANWDDSKRHGNFRRYSKLTLDQVNEIRERGEKGEAAYSIAKCFPVSDTQIRNILNGNHWSVEAPIAWPLGNVWMGVSVEDQRAADERIPDLLATPAAVRWISAEPLLGPVDLLKWLDPTGACCGGEPEYRCKDCPSDAPWRYSIPSDDGMWAFDPTIDWIVCGGESGPGARPMHPDWARSLRDQCKAAGVPFFFKQWGEWAPPIVEIIDAGGSSFKQWDDGTWSERIGKKQAGRLIDGREWSEYPA